MPDIAPPPRCPGTPVLFEVGAGQLLVRVHDARRQGIEFNATPRPALAPGDPVAGGRFDSVDGSYAYAYVAFSDAGAFAESFARDLDYTRSGPRPLPMARVRGRALSAVTALRTLVLVEIQGAAAQQLGQDDWLTTCDEAGYPTTRRWSDAIRAWVPSADGLIWRSKRDPEERVVVLWGNPATASTGCGILAAVGDPLQLNHGFGRHVLESCLIEWRLYLED